MTQSLLAGGKVLTFGNGGSAADAQHLAGELVGRFLRDRAALPALALTTDPSVVTAIGNDLGYDAVFRRQVEAHGRPGDVAVGITTSGRSPNVVLALELARDRGLVTIGMTGGGGGARSPSTTSSTPHRGRPASGGPHHGRPHPLPGGRGGCPGDERAAGASTSAASARTRLPAAEQVSRADFARPPRAGARVASCSTPCPVRRAGAAGPAPIRARSLGKPILWGLGAHVLKVGLSPVLLDLMEKGLVTGLALNGAGIVHDFELAVAGNTSEDVSAGLGSGEFGMARETGEEINRAIVEGDRDGLGLGASVGRYLLQRKPPHLDVSLLAAAARRGLPATVHVAVGTDIVHMHPACDPAALGRATHLDFRLFAAEVARLGGGGVYLNVGSAVMLPEVFLKAVTLARNLGHELADFATANLDFIQSYRPSTNVVERPTRGVGRGYSLTGHHEILVPLLAAALIEGSPAAP
jgi:hypothetical protein